MLEKTLKGKVGSRGNETGRAHGSAAVLGLWPLAPSVRSDISVTTSLNTHMWKPVSRRLKEAWDVLGTPWACTEEGGLQGPAATHGPLRPRAPPHQPGPAPGSLQLSQVPDPRRQSEHILLTFSV